LAILESELDGVLLVEGGRRGDKSSPAHFRCFIAFRKAAHAHSRRSAAKLRKTSMRQSQDETCYLRMQ
jgi:hypothetical protein